MTGPSPACHDVLMSEDAPITARDEIRASVFGRMRCPSCGGLAAELLGRHNLILLPAEGIHGVVECRDGERVKLESYSAFRAGMNIALADDVTWFAETRGLREAGFPVIS
jgi:hypothetical protein